MSLVNLWCPTCRCTALCSWCWCWLWGHGTAADLRPGRSCPTKRGCPGCCRSLTGGTRWCPALSASVKPPPRHPAALQTHRGIQALHSISQPCVAQCSTCRLISCYLTFHWGTSTWCRRFSLHVCISLGWNSSNRTGEQRNKLGLKCSQTSGLKVQHTGRNQEGTSDLTFVPYKFY